MRISTTRCVWPEVSPFRHSAPRERLKYQASPVAMVLASASAFICATMSTSPEPASVATQVTRPSASNFGVNFAPSSRSTVWPGAANGALLDMTAVWLLHGLAAAYYSRRRRPLPIYSLAGQHGQL